jgi:hypothetical protein
MKKVVEVVSKEAKWSKKQINKALFANSIRQKKEKRLMRKKEEKW